MNKQTFVVPIMASLLLVGCMSQDDAEKKRVSTKTIIDKALESSSDNQKIQHFSYTVPAPNSMVNLPDLQVEFFSTNSQLVNRAYQQAKSIYLSQIDRWFSWKGLKGLSVQINRALQRGEVMVLNSSDTNYLKQLKDLSLASSGKFNAAMGWIQELWQFPYYADGEVQRVPPLTKKLNRASAQKFNMRDVVFIARGVYSKNPSIQLDLYSTIQGYLVENIFQALLSFSSLQWGKIQIGTTKKILNLANNYVYPVEINELSVHTTFNQTVYLCHGDVLTQMEKRRKTLTYQGKKFHYVLDSKTARPMITKVDKVMIFGQNAVRTQAAAMASFIAKDKQWQRVLRNMKIADALAIYENQQVKLSQAMETKLSSTQSSLDCLLKSNG